MTSLYHEQYITHVRWYISIRWLYLTAIMLSGIITQLVALGLTTRVKQSMAVVGAGIIANAIFYLLARLPHLETHYYYILAFIQIGFDILLVSLIVLIYGGEESKTLLLYAIPLFAAGAMFGRRALAFAVVATILAFDTMVLTQAAHIAPVGSPMSTVLVTVIYCNTVFILIGFIARRTLQMTADRYRERYIEQLNLNSAKNQFVSLASHQLRTPATAVKQYIGMLQQGYAGELTPNQKKMIDAAFNANERQLKVVNDILNVSQIETGTLKLHKAICNLNQVIARIVREQTYRADECNQAIKLKLPAKDIILKADADRLTMVINYIIDNACKYSKDGSEVEVKLRKVKGNCIITIKDHGVGIAEEDLEKLYKKFSRITNELSEKAGGSGLGLYVSKNIVEMHGGTISVKSKLHKGTTFTITLPIISS